MLTFQEQGEAHADNLRLRSDGQHRSYCWDEDQRVQIGISPRRIPRVTASVRVEAPSLSRIELMWNLTVCSEMPRRAAISLLTSPSANILSTSVSREVISSDISSSTSNG